MDREQTADHRSPPRPPFENAPSGLCRLCGGAVDAAGRRRRWHPRCLSLWLVCSDHRFRRAFIFERDNGQCAACPTHIPDLLGRWHVDHIVRLADAPRDLAFWLPSNLATLCVPCHLVKTAGENRAP